MIDRLMSDHRAFNDFVYTPVQEAIKELKRRSDDAALDGAARTLMGDDIPSYLTEGQPKGVLFRQVSTPNHEVRRFFSIMDAIDELAPLLGEHREDRFSTANDYKCSWGRLSFNKKTEDKRFDNLRVIDFQAWDGHPLSEVRTLWGQDLIEFHHELFEATYRQVDAECFQNISPWLKRHGGSAKAYYGPVLAWFLKHAVLFENFMIGDGKEHAFTRSVFLPAFLDTYRKAGVKPLIVNLVPTTIEGEGFWLCHPCTSKHYIEEKLKPRVLS